MARTLQLDDPSSSIPALGDGCRELAAYVAVAPGDDRWLPLAKAHLTSSQRHARASQATLRLAIRESCIVPEDGPF